MNCPMLSLRLADGWQEDGDQLKWVREDVDSDTVLSVLLCVYVLSYA